MNKLKKMLFAALIAAVMFSTAAAAEGVITQSACSIVRSGDTYQVYCFAQVRNDSDQTICMDEGVLKLHNGDQLMAMQDVGQLNPYFLSPGEEGFLFDVVTFEPNEDGIVVPSVTNLTYEIEYMEIDALYAGQKLATNARLEHNAFSGDMMVICEITNPTAQDIFHPTVAFGLYSDAGQLLYADGVLLSDVGIPAGGTVLARFDVDDVFVSQWSSYGVTPEKAQVSAMFRSEAD